MEKTILFALCLSLFLPGVAIAVDNYPSPSCANQASSLSGCTGAIITAIGTKQATIVYRHSTSAIGTPYAVTTALVFPSNITVEMERGAYFSMSGSGAVTGLKTAYSQWFNLVPDSLTSATANTAAANKFFASSTSCIVSPGIYYHDGLITIGAGGNYYSYGGMGRFSYTGSGGTAMRISAPIRLDRLVQSRTADFTDSAVGVEITSLRRSHADIVVSGFPIGMKLNPSIGNPVAYNDFWLTLTGNKVGLYMTAVTGSFISQNKFFRFEASGLGTGSYTAGYYGVYEESGYAGVIYDMTWYSPSMESGLEYGFSFAGTTSSGNHTIISPEFEGNKSNIATRTAYGAITVIGGISTGTQTALVDYQDIYDPATVINLIDYRHNDDQGIFFGEGMYRGKSQGFVNLLTNASFEAWNGSACVGWTTGDHPTQEGTIVKDGTYSAKYPASASGTYDNWQVLATNLLKNAKGKYLTLSGWLYATDINDATNFYITDSVGTTYALNGNATLTANTWQKWSVTRKIDATATYVNAGFRIGTNASKNIYIDGLMLTFGHNVPEYAPKALNDSEDAEIAIPGKGLILTSPDGSKRLRIGIDNSGAVTTTTP